MILHDGEVRGHLQGFRVVTRSLGMAMRLVATLRAKGRALQAHFVLPETFPTFPSGKLATDDALTRSYV